ncbi:hypothetical protein SUGI_1163920 [Cryptomeria japonica]|nr:hypothetical protein SUGI_1163920 [Cryptomeria japonica]
MQFCIILLLSSYIALDLSIHSATPTLCDCPRQVVLGKEGDGLQNATSRNSIEEGRAWIRRDSGGKVAVSRDNDDELCATRDGHRETTSREQEKDMAWRQMKWIGKAASCRVKRHLIEKLDDVNNFRRGFVLKFTGDGGPRPGDESSPLASTSQHI